MKLGYLLLMILVGIPNFGFALEECTKVMNDTSDHILPKDLKPVELVGRISTVDSDKGFITVKHLGSVTISPVSKDSVFNPANPALSFKSQHCASIGADEEIDRPGDRKVFYTCLSKQQNDRFHVLSKFEVIDEAAGITYQLSQVTDDTDGAILGTHRMLVSDCKKVADVK